MTEENPTPDQVPADAAPLPPAQPQDSGETQILPTPQDDPFSGLPPAPPIPQNDPFSGLPSAAPAQPEASAPLPPVDAPLPPAPLPPVRSPQTAAEQWAPATEDPFPSAEEDAAIREHRARRYGASEDALSDPNFPSASEAPAAPAFPPAQPAESPAPAAPVASAFPPVQAAPPAAPAVTPLPAAPATQYHDPVTAPSAPAATTALPQTPQTQPAYDEFESLDVGPVSRAAAHWWTILITLVFAPVAWYLFTDGGARIEWAGSQGTPIAVATYIEYGLGLLAVFIFLLAARWSSVGSIILGSLFFILGVATLIFPSESANILVNATDYFGRLGQFGLNVHEHLTTTLESGRMAVYGLVMIMVGVVSHGARRQGRREERTKIALGE